MKKNSPNKILRKTIKELEKFDKEIIRDMQKDLENIKKNSFQNMPSPLIKDKAGYYNSLCFKTFPEEDVRLAVEYALQEIDKEIQKSRSTYKNLIAELQPESFLKAKEIIEKAFPSVLEKKK